MRGVQLVFWIMKYFLLILGCVQIATTVLPEGVFENCFAFFFTVMKVDPLMAISKLYYIVRSSFRVVTDEQLSTSSTLGHYFSSFL